MSQADRATIEGFLEGDPACLRQIDAWIGEVLRQARLRLGTDAEDVAQQVRRKLLISFRAGRFQGTAALRTYVWRAAQHAAIDHLRRRCARPFPVSVDDVPEAPDPTMSPESALLQRERREIFVRVLDALEEGCRELLQLIVFEEMSYADIALKLRTTEGAIKVRALRCREKAVLEYKSVTRGDAGRPLLQEGE